MNLDFERKLPIPMETKAMYPVTPDLARIVESRAETLRSIFAGQDSRLLLIVGEKEAEEGKVSVRRQGGEASGQPAPAGDGSMTIQEFADFINNTVKEQMSAY